MTFEITAVQRAGWQRLAVARLAAVLEAHRDRPVIAWTAGAAGSCLAGQISGLAAPTRTGDVFDAWCRALAVIDRTVTPIGEGTVRLRAMAHHDHVNFVLTATARLDDVQERR